MWFLFRTYNTADTIDFALTSISNDADLFIGNSTEVTALPESANWSSTRVTGVDHIRVKKGMPGWPDHGIFYILVKSPNPSYFSLTAV
jgi:hypothetical protein